MGQITKGTTTSSSLGGKGAKGGLAIHLALGMWGICSWVVFNGLWGQLPLFVKALPEGNHLGVLIIAAQQLAFFFPSYFMAKKRPQGRERASQESDIWLLLLCGFLISLSLSHFWDYQVVFHGSKHSVGLLLLTFLAGGVCTSTGVVFTPYLSNSPESYTSAYTSGAGLSGVLVAVLTLIADPGAPKPRLSISLYFQIISFVFAVSIAAFTYVNHVLKKEALLKGETYEALRQDEPIVARTVPRQTANGRKGDVETAYGSIARVEDAPPPPGGRRRALWPIFILQCLLASLAYGVLPSLLPIACTGYHDQARVLMLATAGFMVCDPLAKLSTAWLPTHMVWLSGTIALLFALVLMVCAALAPTPPLSQYARGGLVAICANTLFSFSFSFTTTSVFFQKKQEADAGDEEVHKWFKWSAFMIQTGAFLGTFITLLVVLYG